LVRVLSRPVGRFQFTSQNLVVLRARGQRLETQ